MVTPISKVERRKRNLGQLNHPSRASDRVRFPKEFGVRYSVFVDTEEEFDWSLPQSRASIGTSHIRFLPEFQRLAEAHGVKPCYLIDYPVADSPDAIAILRGMMAGGRCTVGTQLHPWVNPPFDEEVNTFNSFVGNLPFALERAKLLALTTKIETEIGVRPVVYRAGRYGIGANSAQLLEELGYRVDTSVRPFFDYSAEGGPNFLRHDARPYWTGPNGLLLELPLGATYTGQLRRFGRSLQSFARNRSYVAGALARTGMVSRVALTPEDMPLEDVKNAISAMIGEGLQYLSFSFHSPSLTPGHTPYVRNSADLSDFYRWWDVIMSHLHSLGVRPAGTDEVIEMAWASRKLRS